MQTDALALEGVKKTFDSVEAVSGLDAIFPTGAICGFLGPNGAGKTTTLRMIMNIISPDSGRIAYPGATSFDAARDRIGYMPEERGLYSKMSVRRVLTYLGGIRGMGGSALARAIDKGLETVELGAWADHKVEELSKGMQQKLQFAATVLHDPEILILDEPFSGLDPLNQDLLTKLLIGERERGRTVIYSTHVMEQAERICDLFVFINRGKKVASGSLDEVRALYPSNAVSLELEGETGFISGLPFVERVEHDGRRLEVSLAPGTDTQDLLRALVDRVRVRAFQERLPSLHEIFIRLVGGGK
jgi:ABC-2 type transport system ATP-binding protein